MTGDGTSELILSCYDNDVILSKQGEEYYLYDKLDLEDVSKAGILEEKFDEKKSERRYDILSYQGDKLVIRILAREYYDDKDYVYWEIEGKNVSEPEFEDWQDKNWYDEETFVSEYELSTF